MLRQSMPSSASRASRTVYPPEGAFLIKPYMDVISLDFYYQPFDPNIRHYNNYLVAHPDGCLVWMVMGWPATTFTDGGTKTHKGFFCWAVPRPVAIRESHTK